MHFREDEAVGQVQTRIGSRRGTSSPSRRFKPSRPLQNNNPVHLRQQTLEAGQVQENWSLSEGGALQEEGEGGERWGLQEQSEENWLAPQESFLSLQQQREEKTRFYNELKWKQSEGEQHFNYQPLPQRLGGGQRNPRSYFF